MVDNDRIPGGVSLPGAGQRQRCKPFSHQGDPSWICCQIGAREHFMIARALASQNALGLLVTDLWSNRRRVVSLPIPRFDARFHPGLRFAPVLAWNLRTFWFETIRSDIKAGSESSYRRKPLVSKAGPPEAFGIVKLETLAGLQPRYSSITKRT